MQKDLPDGGRTTTDDSVLHTLWPCPGMPHEKDVSCEDAARFWAKANHIRVVEPSAK